MILLYCQTFAGLLRVWLIVEIRNSITATATQTLKKAQFVVQCRSNKSMRAWTTFSVYKLVNITTLLLIVQSKHFIVKY